MIGVVVMGIFEVVYVGVQYIALGKLFELLFGISFEAGVIIGAIICVSYTVVGGFTSVARNDFIQGGNTILWTRYHAINYDSKAWWT